MKKLLTLLIGLMMLLPIIAAPQPPAPVKFLVSVNGVNINYEDTKVTNTRTGEVLTKDDVASLEIVNGVGYFNIDKFQLGYEPANPFYGYEGDVIEVIACNVDEDCTINFNILDRTPRTIRISITTGDLHVCWDNSLVSDPNNCPAQPEPEPEYVCWDGSIVSDIVLCPEEEQEDESKVSGDGEIASVEAYYGQQIDVVLTNKKLSKLFDGEIELDGEKYDAKEVILIQAIPETSLFDEDFGTEPYITIPEGAIEYQFNIEDPIDLSEIDEDDSLEIPFTGITLKIIEANESQITVRFGIEISLKEGDTAIVNENKIELVAVLKESVTIKVNGITGSVNLNNNNEINNLDVAVDEISYQGYANGIKLATLIVGDKVQDTYKDGDYFDLFEEDSEEYVWIISLGETQTLGYKNTEAYIGIDEDDDYKAIGVGESIVLPNSFLEINFASITTPTETEINFKVKDGYLYVKGPEDAFSYGTEEYDRLYINSDGFHDEDKEYITDEEIRIGDSETYLEHKMVRIMDLAIELDMSDILYNGESQATEDGNFMDYLGIKWFDAENGVDDKEGFKVSIPEEDPEALITFEINIAPIDDDVVIITPVDDEDEVIVIPPVVDDDKDDIPPVIVTKCSDGSIAEPGVACPKEDEESDLSTILITLIATIIGFFAWGKGFAGLIKYYLRLADEAAKAGDKELAEKYRARAEKMAKTVVTNFLAGKYKK